MSPNSLRYPSPLVSWLGSFFIHGVLVGVILLSSRSDRPRLVPRGKLNTGEINHEEINHEKINHEKIKWMSSELKHPPLRLKTPRLRRPPRLTSTPHSSTEPKTGGVQAAAPTPEAPKQLFDRIRNQINAALLYPTSLRQRRIQGRVRVQLVIHPEGDLESTQVLESSGFSELDQLALQAIHDAAPFPAQELYRAEDLKKRAPLKLSLPIDFLIK